MNASRPANSLDTPNPLRIHEQAAEWLLRREDSNWSAADQHAFEAWLATTPLHQKTWQRMQHTQAVLQNIRQASDLSWRQSTTTTSHPVAADAADKTAQDFAREATSSHHTGKPRFKASSLRFRWAPSFALASITLLVLGGGGFYWWDNTPTYILQAQTGQREMRTIELPDNSRIALNVASSVQVSYYPRRRETTLQQGEAFFQVSANTQKPFTVKSGRSLIKVVGTAFNVNAASSQLVVQVSEGVVEVQTNASDKHANIVQLRAGAGLALNPVTLQYQPLHPPPEAIAEWRSGQVSFRRTPLQEVAVELSRYLGQPVALAKPELGTQTISAVISTARPEAFLRALPDLLPLSAQQQADGSWLISEK